MTPLTKRRIKNFKANKRGYISFWLFIILFVLSLGAEFITNDKPIFIWQNGNAYFPFVADYAEIEFGGDFETKADYTDPYVIDLINKDGFIINPLLPYSFDTINYNLSASAPTKPDAANILGTDDQGRDVLARLIYGFRISVVFGFLLTILSSFIGVIMGAIQGYFGGRTDLILQRFMEVWSGLPELYILIIIASIVVPGFWMLLGILLLFSWIKLVDLVRAEFLRVRNFEYVKAARALGVKERSIIIRHILPNALVATITFLPFILSGSIAALTALDYLGLGMPAGSPSLGEVLAQGHANLSAPWLGISGFIVIATLLALLTFIGEAIRDAFDPKKNLA